VEENQDLKVRGGQMKKEVLGQEIFAESILLDFFFWQWREGEVDNTTDDRGIYCVRGPALFLYSAVWDLHPYRKVGTCFPDTIIIDLESTHNTWLGSVYCVRISS